MDTLLIFGHFLRSPHAVSVLKGYDSNDVSWVCLGCVSSTCLQETHAHYVQSTNLPCDRNFSRNFFFFADWRFFMFCED